MARLTNWWTSSTPLTTTGRNVRARRCRCCSARSARGHTVSTLTGRENDIVELLREQLSNKEIASRLGISSRTVKNQLHHLYEKRGVHSRGELIAQMWSQT